MKQPKLLIRNKVVAKKSNSNVEKKVSHGKWKAYRIKGTLLHTALIFHFAKKKKLTCNVVKSCLSPFSDSTTTMLSIDPMGLEHWFWWGSWVLLRLNPRPSTTEKQERNVIKQSWWDGNLFSNDATTYHWHQRQQTQKIYYSTDSTFWGSI